VKNLFTFYFKKKLVILPKKNKMEYIFHEVQDGSLCAQHCLNSLLQGDYFTAVDLANIAHELDAIERTFMSEAGTATTDYARFLAQESSNYDDTGFFSIQVLQKALESWNIELIPYTSQSSDYAVHARLNPTEQTAFICHFKHHWYTIRKIAFYWFNLNSLLKQPELISDTYLSMLLSQLENDGYSIFIVKGELSRNVAAETHLTERPLNVKEILAAQTAKKKRGQKSIRGNHDDDDESGDFDDEELKKAIKMSLYENDLDLDNTRLSNKLYTSLAHEVIQPQCSSSSKRNEVVEEENEEALLEKAIQMSMESKATPPEPIKLNADEVRRKRLEFLEKSSQKKN
jgi:Ataxin-3